jgi:hypothetical protein
MTVVIEIREMKRLSKRIKENYYRLLSGEQVGISDVPVVFSTPNIIIMARPKVNKVVYIGEGKKSK